jgi:HD superfamily phosphohydrolase
MSDQPTEDQISETVPLIFRPGEELTRNDENRYTVLNFIGRGGTGEVYQLDSSLHGTSRIAKVFVPFYFLEKIRGMGIDPTTAQDLTAQVFQHFEGQKISQSEYTTLAQLSHPYIASVHDLIRIQLTGDALERMQTQYGPTKTASWVLAIVAEYVDGLPLLDFVAKADNESILRSLVGVAEALDYLNLERSVLHCDIKSANVLVRASGLPTVVDFGLAQEAEVEDDRPIAVATELLPTTSSFPSVASIRSRLLRGELVRRGEFLSAFYPWLDRYQFGLLLSDVANMESALTATEGAYLQTVATVLKSQDWLSANRDLPLADLVRRADGNRTYPVVRTGARADDVHIPSPIRPINVAPRLARLARHPALVRLNRQNQLGLLPARFPGATHTRYLHSLDAYRLARSFARRLVDVPHFRFWMSEHDVTELLVAALLHDINHLPFLHIFQEIQDRSWLPDPLSLAFEYGAGVESIGEVIADLGFEVERVKTLIRGGGEPGQLSAADSVIVSAINSGLDVDKLSYLQLDSMMSGLSFASGMDIPALFDAAMVLPLAQPTESWVAENPVICFDSRARDAIEGVVRARTEAFEQLYWCPENRAMMSAFTDTVRTAVATPQRKNRLADLISTSAGMSDHHFLEQLDKQVGTERPIGAFQGSLASFFDGQWSILGLAAIVDDPETVARISAVPEARFNAFVQAVREEICKQGDVLLVDVPRRTLSFGGPVFVADAGKASDIASSTQLAPYQRRLEQLSRRISVFTSEALSQRVGKDPEGRKRELRQVLRGVLSSDNWS